MEEISTSFCFICLLHLANEQGLKLESEGIQSLQDDVGEDQKVGNIWDLKVRPLQYPSLPFNDQCSSISPGIQRP